MPSSSRCPACDALVRALGAVAAHPTLILAHRGRFIANYQCNLCGSKLVHDPGSAGRQWFFGEFSSAVARKKRAREGA